MITGKFMSSEGDYSQALALRAQIFTGELAAAFGAEADKHDAVALYAVTFDESGAEGATGRLFMDDDYTATISHVGSKATMRGQGLADLAMRMLLYRVLEMGLERVKLIAPLDTAGFFERFGFAVCGKPFDMADGLSCTLMRVEASDINIEGKCHQTRKK